MHWGKLGKTDNRTETERLMDKARARAANQRKDAERNAAREEQREIRGIATRTVARMEKQSGRAVKPQQPIDLRLMSIDELEDLVKTLLRHEKYDWRANARPSQLFPEGCITWLLMAGRGFGKTRAAVEAVREVCMNTPGASVAMVAKDHRALRDVCLEGRSGIIACFPPEDIKKIHKGLGDVSVELTNGSVIRGYTAGEPDAVRGQAFDMIWGDEFAAWPKNRAKDMLAQLRLCLRESRVGSVCILSTTPKRIPHVVEMVKLAEDPAEKIVVTRGRSRDNTALTDEWHRQMEREYGGTRLGRQELDGELVMDAERGLWTENMIHDARWDPSCKCNKDVCVCSFDLPQLLGVMTGVDPSGSKDGDATGIVTVGWDKDKQLYVLENKTTKGEPGVRYNAVCMSAHRHGSGQIWYEAAYGGDNAAFGIEQAWKNLQRDGLIPEDKKCPRTMPSTIKGDKAARAMPVVHLYEQQVANPGVRRIWHVAPTLDNGMVALENEQVSWETDDKKSPNAIDALVHVCRAIMNRIGITGQISSPASPHSTRRMPRGRYDPYGGR